MSSISRTTAHSVTVSGGNTPVTVSVFGKKHTLVCDGKIEDSFLRDSPSLQDGVTDLQQLRGLFADATLSQPQGNLPAHPYAMSDLGVAFGFPKERWSVSWSPGETTFRSSNQEVVQHGQTVTVKTILKSGGSDGPDFSANFDASHTMVGKWDARNSVIKCERETVDKSETVHTSGKDD